MIDEKLIVQVSQITELNDISKFLQDEDVDLALARLIQIKTKPDLPADTAMLVMEQLQACASMFGLKATFYAALNKGPSGSDEFKKKNLYYSMEERINRLVDALKYQVRK